MRQARKRQFDPNDPPWLHLVSRCVRRAFLCGNGYEHRKDWIERRLRILARCFSIRVGAYAIMSNHIHVVVRPQPELTSVLSADEVARAWWFLRQNVDPHEGLDAKGNPVVPDEAHIQALASNNNFVATWSERLGSASWFMKELKEPLSRLANREDGCTGAFWEGRFTSVPLLDAPAVIACMAYVDLNPIRAQLAAVPEESAHTSVKTRIEQREARHQAKRLRSNGERGAANQVLQRQHVRPTADPAIPEHERPDAESERGYRSWLTPVTEMTSAYATTFAPGMGLTMYLKLVEATGKLVRGDKKGAIADGLEDILVRIDSEIDLPSWRKSVASVGGLRGSALGTLASLVAEAKRRGLEWIQRRTALFRIRPAS